MASSFSPGTWRYHVFTSFHGPDVRKTFLTHLRKQFRYNGISMFDDQGIERSQIIAPALTQAIRGSRISIVVLSKNYASSSWCLDELVEIFKCKEKIGQIVMTIFYDVDPSNVRKQTGEFGKVFKKTCRHISKEKRQKWSKALEDVANIAGEHFLNWDNESKMIEKIARDVSNKLNVTISWDFEDMVGIEAHLQNMQSLLHLDYEDGAMIVGICGPAGIGKTTIARALHSRLSSSFQLNYFMENTRGNYNSGVDEFGSKMRLQEKFLSKILNQDGMKVDNLGAIRVRLCGQKVLIILDDVDDLKQLEALAGETNWFGPGSRIIVITEDRELLKKHDIDNTYHVAFPTEEEARKIFCRYAFKKSSRPDGFEKLIERVTKFCSKLPLGLRVMGSYLCRKTKDDWEDILQRLENSLDPIERDIERVLRVGYESITEQYQLLFLFIAFFFNYDNVDHVKDMLTESKLNVRLGLKILENKSLIQISTEGNIVMHKLLQQVGREAVQRQDPRKRQILIDSDEICDVLENESDCTSVMGISFDISTIPNGVRLSARALKRMNNLRFLRIYNNTSLDDTNVRVHVPEDMNFPHRLKLLHWDAYPVKCLPHTFRPEFLVELKLRDTNLEKLWEGIQPLPYLKKMDLYQSMNLKELPDLSKAEHLEQLQLSYCKSLVELPPSIASLHKLERLEMDFCEKLLVVPTHFNLASLHHVSMWECNQLRNIPDIARNITELEITDKMLEEVPDSIRFCHLKCFRIFGNLNGGLDIEKIPDWIKDLHQLEELYISYCPKLASLTELPASLERLTVEYCESLETLIPFPGDSPILFLFFPNCFKLDRKARRVITQQSWHACLPGNTIPVEFNQRALGNSLTIRSDFHHFRICVLVSPNKRMDDEWDIKDDDTFLCAIRINGCPVKNNIYHEVLRIEMEHLFMSYVLFLDEDEGWPEQDNEILFEFSTTSSKFDILQCGVQTLTGKPIFSYESSSEEFSEDDNESLFDGSNE